MQAFEADYIVVGAGSAGCAIAARLSEDPGVKVLLLEAGGSDEDFLIRMPLGFLRALFKPQYTWGYLSEPEPQLNGRKLWLPRGKLLGGSSSVNGMFYMRGHSRDFDGWSEAGCTGWSYAEVLPYFKRMETSWRGAGPWHGGKGPLSVRAIDTSRLLHEPLMATAEANGYQPVQDLHGELEEGFAKGEATIDPRGRRSNTAQAYLKPAAGRPNLRVLTGAQTTRVLFDGNRATGVELLQGGQLHQAYAAREVVLCGGAFNSPHLLMLSGIGPAAELQQHGIPVRVDAPAVGQNLSEHPRVPVEFTTRQPITFLNQLRMDRATFSVLRWFVAGTGAFASQLNSCNIVVRTQEQLDRPDVQLMCNPVRMDAKLWWPGGAQQQHRITADVVLLHPEARGHVSLRSADPLQTPRVQLNLFQSDADFATAWRGMQLARRIYATEPMRSLVADETAPGPAVNDRAAFDAYVRKAAGVTQHPVGTCRMGSDNAAVLDPQLRVRGVEGLRVADASVMPTVPGGNTNAASIMIGEVAADLLRGRKLPPEYLRGEPPA